MSAQRKILVCARYRANSPVAPMSITRRCERCFCLVMTSPSSQPLIDEGAEVLCTRCGAASAPIDSEYEMLPGQYEELARLLGPVGALAAAAAIETVNRSARRGKN